MSTSSTLCILIGQVFAFYKDDGVVMNLTAFHSGVFLSIYNMIRPENSEVFSFDVRKILSYDRRSEEQSLYYNWYV